MSNVVKVTKRDYFLKLAQLDAVANDDELTAFIAHEIELLDVRAQKAKSYAKKNKADSDELTNSIVGVLTDEAQTIPEILTALAALDEKTDATAQKVTYRLTKLVEANIVTKSERSIKEDGKPARKVCAYTIAAATND